jgi:hypothetical protein
VNILVLVLIYKYDVRTVVLVLFVCFLYVQNMFW